MIRSTRSNPSCFPNSSSKSRFSVLGWRPNTPNTSHGEGCLYLSGVPLPFFLGLLLLPLGLRDLLLGLKLPLLLLLGLRLKLSLGLLDDLPLLGLLFALPVGLTLRFGLVRLGLGVLTLASGTGAAIKGILSTSIMITTSSK